MENYSYLDNAATTVLYPELVETYAKYSCKVYGNPSSLHAYGKDAARALDYSRRLIASSIGAQAKQIIFTSGATEANESIIASATAPAFHALSSKLEHSSVIEALKAHAKDRHKLIGNDADGNLDLEELKSTLAESKENYKLASFILVNNEISTITDYASVAAIIRNSGSKAIFHLDATQAVGKIEIDVSTMDIDALSASAHKFHGPKGVGFLYLKNPAVFKALIHGGGQEFNLRSGTQNIAGICQMAKALSMSASNLKESYDRISSYKNAILDYVKTKPQLKTTISSTTAQSPYILSLCYPKIPSEVLLHRFEERGVLVSSGSACSNNSGSKSGVISNIGINLNENAVIRVSFSRMTGREDIERFIRASDEILERTVF